MRIFRAQLKHRFIDPGPCKANMLACKVNPEYEETPFLSSGAQHEVVFMLRFFHLLRTFHFRNNPPNPISTTWPYLTYCAF